MKNYLFPTIVMLSALTLAGGAALFTVLGFRELFGPTLLITLMATSIEVGKIVAVSAMYQLREVINWFFKSILLVMIIVAMLVTSMGVYGYLSSAYQRDSLAITTNVAKTELILDRKVILQDRLDAIDKQIGDIAPNYITKRMELIETFKPERESIRTELDQVNQDEVNLKLDKLEKEAEFGAIVLLSKSVDWLDESKSMLYFIALIIFIFDPLAIALTYIANIGYASVARRKAEEHTEEVKAIFNGTDPDELFGAITDKLDKQNEVTAESLDKLSEEIANVRDSKPKSDKGAILDSMRKVASE